MEVPEKASVPVSVAGPQRRWGQTGIPSDAVPVSPGLGWLGFAGLPVH